MWPALNTSIQRGNTGQLSDTNQVHRWVNALSGGVFVLPAATGNAETDNANLNAAIASGKTVLLTSGEYRYTALDFDQTNQVVECCTGAVLRAETSDSTIEVSARGVIWRDMRVNANLATGVAVLVSNSDFEAYSLKLDAGKAAVALKVEDSICPRLFGGRITGNSNDVTGIGIEIATGTYKPSFHALTISHYDTAVRISAEGSVDEPAFVDCIFDNCLEYGIRFDPDSEVGAIYTPLLLNIHFEGCVNNIYVGTNGHWFGGVILACRFGRNTQRVLTVDGVIRYAQVGGCFLAAEHIEGAIVYELNGVNEWAIEELIDTGNLWREVSALTTGTRADKLKRMVTELVSV